MKIIENHTQPIILVEIKDCIMIDGRHFFDQLINIMTKTYENFRKIPIGQGDCYTTGCLLD